ARGAHVVAIDPYRTPTAQQADEHLMVRPGTDAALALAVMHVLVAEGRVDHGYIARATLGFDRLAEHLRAYSPEAVAPIVGLDAETIDDRRDGLGGIRSEEHTSELQSRGHLVCRLLLEKKKIITFFCLT